MLATFVHSSKSANNNRANRTYGSISPGLLDPTGEDLAMYYARLIGYLKNGTMVDERGHTHRMPPGSRTFNFTYLLHQISLASAFPVHRHMF